VSCTIKVFTPAPVAVPQVHVVVKFPMVRAWFPVGEAIASHTGEPPVSAEQPGNPVVAEIVFTCWPPAQVIACTRELAAPAGTFAVKLAAGSAERVSVMAFVPAVVPSRINGEFVPAYRWTDVMLCVATWAPLAHARFGACSHLILV